jgi:predicted DNA-binding transcriptional regulator YafY
MTKTHTDQRDRTLLLARILQEETDLRHPLSLQQLIQRLEDQGAPAERKSVYRDLAALRRHGMAIDFRRGKAGGWYLAQRTFSSEELGLIADAIGVYPYLSAVQRAALLEQLEELSCVHQRHRLRRPVSLAQSSEQEAGAMQAVLERVHTACQEQRALSFIPYDYNSKLEKVPVGSRQLVSPKGLLWTGQGYRLLAWDHEGEVLRLYRLDRMGKVLIAGAPAQGPAADAGLWASVPFGLDPQRRERVKLRCRKELAGEAAERFGPEAVAAPMEDGFLLTADVVLGPEFWAWLRAYQEQAELVGPTIAVELWREQCRETPLQAWAV